MNHHALLVDFGASRIKSTLNRLDDACPIKIFQSGILIFRI